MPKQALTLVAILLTAAGLPAIAAQAAPGGPAQPAQASGGDKPSCGPQDVVDNDDLRIWFHGHKFQLKVFKKNESTGAVDGKYQYKSMEIAELDEGNATVSELKLENAEPHASECEIEESGQWINVTYTVTDEVRKSDGEFVGEAQVEFVYHFNQTDDSSKFDLNVQEWPWAGNDTGHELAYEFDVTSDWTIEPAENGLGFRDEESGEAEAFIEWAPNATAYYDDGHNETAIVDANTTGSDHHTTTNLRFTNATAGYNELDYDPRVAVGPYIIVADILVPLTEVPEPLREIATSTI